MNLLAFLFGDFAWKLGSILALHVASASFGRLEIAAIVAALGILPIAIALGDLGFKLIGTRLIVLHPERRAQIQAHIQSARLFAGTLSIAALSAYLIWTSGDVRTHVYAVALLWAYWPYFFNVDWVLLAQHRHPQILATKMVATFVLGCGLLAVYRAPSLGPTAFIGAFALATTSAALISRWGTVAAKSRNLLGFLRENTKESLTLSAGAVVTSVFHTADFLALSALHGTGVSATYAASMRIVLPLSSVGWMLVQYAAPRFVTRSGSRDLMPAWFVLPGAAIGALCMAAAPAIELHLYNGAFPDLTQVLRIHALTLPLDAVAAALAMRCSMNAGSRRVLAATLIGVLALVIGSAVAPLVTAHEPATGAATARVLAYVVLLAALLRYRGP
jgi:hypothetical protein